MLELWLEVNDKPEFELVAVSALHLSASVAG